MLIPLDVLPEQGKLCFCHDHELFTDSQTDYLVQELRLSRHLLPTTIHVEIDQVGNLHLDPIRSDTGDYCWSALLLLRLIDQSRLVPCRHLRGCARMESYFRILYGLLFPCNIIVKKGTYMRQALQRSGLSFRSTLYGHADSFRFLWNIHPLCIIRTLIRQRVKSSFVDCRPHTAGPKKKER